jgi:hypothetical protein
MQRAAQASGIAGEQLIRVVELGVLWGIEGYYRERGDGVLAPIAPDSVQFVD